MLIIALPSIEKVYGQAIDLDINRYEELRKLTTGQDGYTTGCLLYYDYIKKYYRFRAVDLSKPKELDLDPKATHQIESVEQFKNVDNVNANGEEYKLFL